MWNVKNRNNSICFSCGQFDVSSTYTKPDFSFAIGMQGIYQNNSYIDYWKAAKKALRYLQGTKDYILTYKRSDHIEVIGYSDSDFAGCVDSRKSMFSYLFLLIDGAFS